ncbi:glycogenin-1-like isoform X4 [Xenia sp. Carnegie-2017]|uniref:glycogenin-1-like isoform X4 n=1 Tax=Xenia sp. Carnegie-2017 TaxID=2897299 RepID=UPI001F040ED9|nr:glycogenin-1-like isoform X4 [Xenia sp. Carnegie-2017]
MLIFCQKYNSMFGDFGGRVNNQAFVSLATNNGYALGALVLGHSLRSVNTNRQLALMITPEVNIQVRQELLAIWDRLVMVDILDSEDTANLALLQRPDLGITFTKLQGWKLTEYVKCVFLDADTLVLQNIDDLFNRPEISAAPDIGWPDCFNTGVFVFVPSKQTYDALVAHALAVGSFDGGDQGLLNSFFNDWLFLGPEHRLPFVYNLHSNASYSYSPAFRRFGSNVKIVHFIGRKKPWQYSINLETGKVVHDYGIISVTSSEQFIQQWWDVYNEIAAHKVTSHEINRISNNMGNLQIRLLNEDADESTSSPSQPMSGRWRWEYGHIDYVGVDRFENIERRLNETLSS